MALQLSIQLKGIEKPTIWRRLLVPETFTFRQLHKAIQVAFGWENRHLYQFQLQAYNSPWCVREPSDMDGMFDEELLFADKTNVLDFLESRDLNQIEYVYDFGDDWIHEIRLEERTNALMSVARCLDGEGMAPPEDCGGIGGYAHLKSLLAKKRMTKDDLAQIEWFLGNASIRNLGTFNLELTNKLLAKMKL